MFTHRRPINWQNRWLLINTKTAVAALDLNGLGLTPVLKITRLYTKMVLTQNVTFMSYYPSKNSKRKQTREILNLLINFFIYNDEY